MAPTRGLRYRSRSRKPPPPGTLPRCLFLLFLPLLLSSPALAPHHFSALLSSIGLAEQLASPEHSVLYPLVESSCASLSATNCTACMGSLGSAAQRGAAGLLLVRERRSAPADLLPARPTLHLVRLQQHFVCPRRRPAAVPASGASPAVRSSPPTSRRGSGRAPSRMPALCRRGSARGGEPWRRCGRGLGLGAALQRHGCSHPRGRALSGCSAGAGRRAGWRRWQRARGCRGGSGADAHLARGPGALCALQWGGGAGRRASSLAGA